VGNEQLALMKLKKALNYLLIALVIFAGVILELPEPILKFFPVLNKLKQSPLGLIFIILGLLYLLLYMRISPDVSAILAGIRELNLHLKELSLISMGNSVVIEPAKHPEIWDGFINTYYVVNAPWQLEKNMDTVEYDEMVKLHAKRYMNPNLKRVIYIFFKENPFPNSLKNFSEFMKRVMEISPQAAEKVYVIEVDGKAPPYSIFLGEKKLSPEHEKFKLKNKKEEMKTVSYSILYINERPFLTKDGFPHWAFLSINSKLNEILKYYVRNLEHESSVKQPVADFIGRFLS